MRPKQQWQVALATLINAGFSEERALAMLAPEPKDSIDDVSDLPRNEFEALNAFNKLMWAKLYENRHKGSWLSKNPFYWLDRLKKETTELREALDHLFLEGGLKTGYPESAAVSVAKECADVANIAMFIADAVGQLKYERRG